MPLAGPSGSLAEQGAHFQGDATKQASKQAFQLLPVEVNQQIGYCLENDGDIANFAAVCTSTANAIYGDERHFWLVLFQSMFDKPTEEYKKLIYTHNRIFQEIYCRFRNKVSHLRGGFKNGKTAPEVAALKEIVQLMNEAHPTVYSAEEGAMVSRNVQFLEDFVLGRSGGGGSRPLRPLRSFGLLDNIFRPHVDHREATSLLNAVRLCFTHYILSMAPPDFTYRSLIKTYSWEDSKAAVFEMRTFAQRLHGDFHDGSIDFEFLLHIVNYFQLFFTDHSIPAKKFYVESELGMAGMPHGWITPFSNQGCSLGTNWKGSFAYLQFQDLINFRQDTAEDYDDRNVDGAEGDPFQSLEIQESSSPATLSRLSQFEPFLRNGITYPMAEDKSKFKSFALQMHGVDASDVYKGVGCVTPLPAQEGIRGFQRLTMMKYYEDSAGNFDPSILWAYEGLVLPGGNIMLGRWFRANLDSTAVWPDNSPESSGPFIFWNLPDAAGKTRGKTADRADELHALLGYWECDTDVETLRGYPLDDDRGYQYLAASWFQMNGIHCDDIFSPNYTEQHPKSPQDETEADANRALRAFHNELADRQCDALDYDALRIFPLEQVEDPFGDFAGNKFLPVDLTTDAEALFTPVEPSPPAATAEHNTSLTSDTISPLADHDTLPAPDQNVSETLVYPLKGELAPPLAVQHASPLFCEGTPGILPEPTAPASSPISPLKEAQPSMPTWRIPTPKPRVAFRSRYQPPPSSSSSSPDTPFPPKPARNAGEKRKHDHVEEQEPADGVNRIVVDRHCLDNAHSILHGNRQDRPAANGHTRNNFTAPEPASLVKTTVVSMDRLYSGESFCRAGVLQDVPASKKRKRVSVEEPVGDTTTTVMSMDGLDNSDFTFHGVLQGVPEAKKKRKL